MRRAWIVLAFGLSVVASDAISAAELFTGKTINIVVSAPAGGGYDVYARLFARHLGRFIPGKPTVVVQNMPGAGGAKASGYIAAIAPRDGTFIGAIEPGNVVSPLFDTETKWQYNPTTLVYLATANSGTRICATSSRSSAKTYADALQKHVIMGTIAQGDSTYDYVNMLKHLAHAKFDLVNGYPGTADIFLAMDRGEVEGVCGWDWSTFKALHEDYIRDKRINIILQNGVTPNAELTQMGVPELDPFIEDETDKEAARLIVSQQIFGRPYVAPPGTPEPIVAMLRTAFADAMHDPQFLQDAASSKLDIIPSAGQKAQEGVSTIYSTPKEVVDRARAALAE